MTKCETCGNEYKYSFEVKIKGKSHTYDSFECAIEALAPRCENCGVTVIGHGLESNGDICCSPHCVRALQDEDQHPQNSHAPV
jgi:protein-arginine kinase activator protein McsA